MAIRHPWFGKCFRSSKDVWWVMVGDGFLLLSALHTYTYTHIELYRKTRHQPSPITNPSPEVYGGC